MPNTLHTVQNHSCYFQYCWITCLIFFILWWVVSSGLLWLTWNKVITTFVPVKSASFCQAMLLIATLGVIFCAPRYYAKRIAGGPCGKGKICQYSEDHAKICPHGQSKSSESKEK